MPAMRVSWILLAAAFALLGALVPTMFLSGDEEGDPRAVAFSSDPAARSGPVASDPATRDAVSETRRSEKKARAPRLVAPDVVPVPPVDVTTLQRAAPRLQLTRPKSRAEGGWELRLLHRPVVSAAGRIEAAGHAILIDGIKPVQPGESCPGRQGEEWPCGNLARTALRGWVRGRAVHCRVPEKPMDDAISTSCELGGQDIATWLVRNGWAQPNDPQRFENAAKYARSNGLGIFRPE